MLTLRIAVVEVVVVTSPSLPADALILSALRLP